MKKYQKPHIAKNSLFSVILRKKEGVKTSLYFEIRDKQTKKRYYEFLGKYLTGSSADIDIEAGAKKQANTRLSELTGIGYYINEGLQPRNEMKKERASTFTSYFEAVIANVEHNHKKQSAMLPLCALRCFQRWGGVQVISFNLITEAYLNAFKRSLKPSQHNYFNYVMNVAKQAQRDGLVTSDVHKVKRMKALKPIPITLTEEEVLKLQRTPYIKECIRQLASLQYACGQRFSDVSIITWEQITNEGNCCKISITQKKTDKTLPSYISKELIEWLGKNKERKGLLFPDLPNKIGMVNIHLNRWAKQAGIEKHIGTHTFRRSCATQLYRKGVNIVTISKILGHSNIETTMRYIGVTAEDIFEGLKAIQAITANFDFTHKMKVA